MSPQDVVDGFTGFATLHPVFTFAPALIAGLLLHALARKGPARPVPRRVKIDRR
jgi:hypothetical protein